MKQTRIKEYFKLRDERLQLQQKVDAIERQEKIIKEEMTEEIKKTGGRKKQINIAGKFLLALKPIAGRVNWKDAYIESEGPEAAAELQKKAKPTLRLKVTKI